MNLGPVAWIVSEEGFSVAVRVNLRGSQITERTPTLFSLWRGRERGRERERERESFSERAQQYQWVVKEQDGLSKSAKVNSEAVMTTSDRLLDTKQPLKSVLSTVP